MKRAVPLSVCAVLLAGAAEQSLARAAEPALYTLDWSAPSDCAAKARASKAIDELLGATTSQARVRARATLTPARDGYHVALVTETDGHRGERALEAATCEAATDAVAVIVALMIDPSAASRVAATPEPEEPVPSPASLPLPTGPEAHSAPVASAEPPTQHLKDHSRKLVLPPPKALRIEAGAGALLDFGLLPTAAAGFGAGARVVLGPYRFGLRGGFFPGSRGSLEGDPSRGATLSLALAGLEACRALLANARASASLCVDGEYDRESGAGDGIRHPASGAAEWFALGGGALGVWDVAGPLSLEARASLDVPLSRPRFVIAGLGPVHQAASAGGRGAFSLDLHF